MLRNGHELNMRVTHLLYVGHQLLGQFAVGKPPISQILIMHSLPGTEMHFVNAYRGIKCLVFFARSHPFSIVPLVAVQVPDNGSRFGAQLGQETERIGLYRRVALVAGLDFIFVEITLSQTGDEEFPQTGSPSRPHGVASPVPLVEITYHAHPLAAW